MKIKTIVTHCNLGTPPGKHKIHLAPTEVKEPKKIVMVFETEKDAKAFRVGQVLDVSVTPAK